jgi:hypothetical protein
MEIKEVKEKIDEFVAKNEDVIINHIMICQPFTYRIENNYVDFYREHTLIAMIEIIAITDIY